MFRLTYPVKYLLKGLAVLVLLCVMTYPVRAQYFYIDKHQKQVKLHFKMVRDMIVLPLYINNKGPFNFVLDSGVGIMIITDPALIDSVNIYNKRTIKLFGAGNNEPFEAYLTAPLDMRVGEKIHSQLVSAAILTQDHLGLSNYAGIPIHGLLGHDFFARLDVKICFTDTTMAIAEPGKLKFSRRATKIPISIEELKPYFKTTIALPDGRLVTNKFIVDLGANHPVSLERYLQQNNCLPNAIQANLGIGLTGPITGQISRINEFDLGKYKFKNVLAYFPDSSNYVKYLVPRDGNLGLGILKKFDVLISYQNNLIYLKPNRLFKEPFEHDMSGLEYYAAGPGLKHIIISRVEPGSAGEMAGLMKDDEITAINLKSVARMDIFELDQIFKSRSERNILVEIYRNNKYESVVLTLKRRI